MGDTLDGINDATPVTATVSAFYMDVNEVTLAQWKSVYHWARTHRYNFENPGCGELSSHPVQSVNWYDCVKWCNARSQQAGRTPEAKREFVASIPRRFAPGSNWQAWRPERTIPRARAAPLAMPEELRFPPSQFSPFVVDLVSYPCILNFKLFSL